MKDTRKKIEEAAVLLFNEHGYNQVSLRDIAAQAGTTIGNLTYYFKQKEDLINSILETLQTSFPLKSSKEIHGSALLENLVDSFVSAEANQKNNSFYYKNLYELTKDSEYIAKRGKEFQSHLYEMVVQNLIALREEKIIRTNIDSESIYSFAYTFVCLSTTWQQQNAPYNNELLPQIPITSVLCNLLHLFICESFEENFLEICTKNNINIK